MKACYVSKIHRYLNQWCDYFSLYKERGGISETGIGPFIIKKDGVTYTFILLAYY